MLNQKKQSKKSFGWKSFISFSLFISIFVLAFTGVILYIAPPGRVAKWVNWTLFGVSKEQWQQQHTIFAYAFFILSVFHIFFINWRVFWSYIKRKTVKGIQKRWEMLSSLILMAVLVFATASNVPPFKNVIDLGEYFTESWENKDERAPMPHTESLTVKELSEQVVQLSPEQILQRLRQKQIKAESIDQTLKEIGQNNDLSPFEIYTIIVEKAELRQDKLNSLKPGTGFGRKTLEEIAEILQQDVRELIKKLKDAGIEAQGSDRLKDVAAKLKKRPIEVVEILRNPSQ
jgi:hypothetical protein